MVISRTPFRISFIGGGSDFKEYYQQDYGAVISATIDKYVYLSMHPMFNNLGYHLKYSENEMVDTADKIKHPIIREVFKEYDIPCVDFNSTADIPSGTGLGSSSSFTVGLINLCGAYKKWFMAKSSIAYEASKTEIDKLKSPIGKQDQYASAFGGLNYIRFNSDDSVLLEKIKLSGYKRFELENSLILFYLGGTRSSSSVLLEQKGNILSNSPVLKKMVNLVEELKTELNNNSIDNFGKIMHEGWMYKKELSSNVSNPTIDAFYEKALKNGAEGGKLLGAGNGGFLLLYSRNLERLRTNMKIYELSFEFEDFGTTIIYQ